MNELMNDIIHTADHFVENFSQDPVYTFIQKESLDYSIESLVVVDELLDELRSDLELDEDTLYNMSSMIGCYVFETARKNYGGEYLWVRNEEQPVLVAGRPDFQVSIRAWQKVKGRLVNGKEDSIPFYIAGYQEHIDAAKKGDFIMIV